MFASRLRLMLSMFVTQWDFLINFRKAFSKRPFKQLCGFFTDKERNKENWLLTALALLKKIRLPCSLKNLVYCYFYNIFWKGDISHKMRLLTFLGPFTDRNDRFPFPFISLNQWNPYSFIGTWSPKKVPILGGASLYRL